MKRLKKRKNFLMSIKISIQKLSKITDIPNNLQLKQFINAAILLPEGKTEIALRIVDEAESQELNFAYRQKNKPTNVLAFPYEDPAYLGDLAVCAPIVAKEAKQQGKTILAHWAHLLVHGTLHLQGYDHIIDAERKSMEALEIAILNRLNFPNPYEEDVKHE